MRRAHVWTTGLALVALACSDSPVGTGAGHRLTNAADLGRIAANPPCTVHWAAGVNGSWFDNAKWTPAAVPGSGDVACIDAAGTYTVTMDPAVDATPVAVIGLNLGGASGTQTLTMAGTDVVFNVTSGIDIATSGRLIYNMFGGAKVSAGSGTTNAGAITVLSPCGGCGLTDALTSDLTNTGTISVVGILTLDKVNGAHSNSGTISLAGVSGILIPASTGSPTFSQTGGTVSAPTLALLEMRAGTFTLSGGTLSLSSQSSLPVVRVNGGNLVLSPSLAGSQDIAVSSTTAGTSSVTGDVPSGTTLWITGHGAPGGGSITWNGSPINSGHVRVDINFFAATTLTIAGSGTLVNNGSVVQNQGSGQAIHYTMNIENHGTMSLTAATFLDKPNGLYENFASMSLLNAGVVTVSSGATFRSQNSGTMVNGTLALNGAHLVGTGSVPYVNATNGSTVEPGNPIGILTMPGFNPDVSSSLIVEVNGTQPGITHDQLVVTGFMLYQGTLNLISGPNMGLCGQVLDVVTDNNSAGTRAFTQVLGLNPGAGRSWRTTTPPHRYEIVGYNAGVKVGISPTTLAIAEGGPSASYAVCLSQAPTANVTVAPSPNAQVLAAPIPLTFTTVSWNLPQTVVVTAVDDAVIEAPHTGTVTHTVTSSDPFYNNFAAASVLANITDNDGSADLALTITQPPPPISLNQTFSVGFRVKNNGTTLSTGSKVTFQPVGGFQLVSASGAACTGGPSGVTCTVAGMASAGQVNFTLTVKAIQRGVFQKTMTVTGQQPDPNPANNVLVRSLTVN